MPPERSRVDPVRENYVGGTADRSCRFPEPPTKRRRVFLQTMGQQLRGGGLLQGSPPDCTPGVSSIPRDDVSVVQSLNDTTDSDKAHHVGQLYVPTPESDAIPGEDDQLPAGAAMRMTQNIWQPTEVLTKPALDGACRFTFDDYLAWTRSYFDNWHPAYPFLHAPSILEYFDHIANHGVAEVESNLKYKHVILRSIICISLADYRQTRAVLPPVPSQFVFASFNDALYSIQCALTDETSLVSLQAVVSVQLFFISMLRYNAASRLQGLAIRMAFHLGLHRCPVQFGVAPPQEVQLRQRLFWSIYCIDRSISIRLGIPLSVRDADVGVCIPTSERHGNVENRHLTADSRLELLRLLSKHATIRGCILELRNTSVIDRQIDVDKAIEIEAELSRWWNDVDEYLESSSPSSPSISPSHQVVLAVLRHESVIALHKHTLATSKNKSSYNAAIQSCIGASRFIISTLHKELRAMVPVDASSAQDAPGNSGLLWPSFTWAVWMSTFILAYAASEDQVSADVAIRFIDRALEILDHLSLRSSMWPNACALTIRSLRGELARRSHSDKGNSHDSIRLQREVPETSNQFGLSKNNGTFRNPPNFFTREENPQSNTEATAPSLCNRQNATELHTHGGNVQELSNQQAERSNEGHANGMLESSQLLSGRHNWILSDFILSNEIGSGIVSRLGGQQWPGLQIPDGEWSDLLYGLDGPFWLGNDQWMANGHNI